MSEVDSIAIGLDTKIYIHSEAHAHMENKIEAVNVHVSVTEQCNTRVKVVEKTNVDQRNATALDITSTETCKRERVAHDDNSDTLLAAETHETRRLSDGQIRQESHTQTNSFSNNTIATHAHKKARESSDSRDAHLSRLLLQLATACMSMSITPANFPPNSHRFILLKMALSQSVHTSAHALELMCACTCEKLGRMVEAVASMNHSKGSVSKETDRHETGRHETERHETGRHETDRYETGRHETDRHETDRHTSAVSETAGSHSNEVSEHNNHSNVSKPHHASSNAETEAKSARKSKKSAKKGALQDGATLPQPSDSSDRPRHDENTYEDHNSSRYQPLGSDSGGHGLVNGLVGCVVSFFHDNSAILSGISFQQLYIHADLSVAMECAAYKGRQAFGGLCDEDLCVNMWYKSMRGGGLGKFSKITASREAKVCMYVSVYVCIRIM
jgi:hypothetical protein